MAQPDVEKLAKEFASELSDLLNETICTGVRLNSVQAPKQEVVWVGYKISPTALTSRTAFKIGLGKSKSGLYLNLSFRLERSALGHLSVVSSFIGLFGDKECSKELFHIDYEREKADGYPEAHLQIEANSPHWEKLIESTSTPSDKKRELSKLHFPVGGRLFRPTLEDLIEFLIIERFVKPLEGWNTAI